VINFGSSGASGVTQMTLGGGFRTRLTDNMDFGVAYEKAILSPEGLTDDRFTFDLSIRF
jgi:opacity protein-like surface antigen